jgi:hypothetical protein
MPRHNNVQFDIAEVISTSSTYRYSQDIAGNGLFKFRVRSATQHTKVREYDVKPMNLSNMKMPVIGEIVLVCQTINNLREQRRGRERETWYFVSTLDLQSAINNNKSTGMTWTPSEFNELDAQTYPSGKTFNDQKIISPLQPFEGDTLLQSRYGSSIRFGSTISTMPEEYYHKSPNWLGNTDSDPIIILANGQTNLENKEFVVEDINQDNSSLYLTSTQKIPIVLGNQENPNPLYGCITPNGNETEYIGSQLIGISDRVILKARTDLAVIDSPMGIVLNSTGEIKLGSEEASESMVHGEVLLEVLQNILNQLQTVVQCGSASGTFINLSYANKAQRQLQELLSSKYKMEFKPNK